MCYDKYVLSDTFGASDIITFGRLPSGAKVVDVHVRCPDMGGTGNFKIGHTASADGAQAVVNDAYGTAVDWSGQALSYSLSNTTGFSATGDFEKLAGEVDVIITCNGVTATTSGTIHVAVFYVLD
jgi:hypothetical protein